ncbi:MAG: hypothetical protein OEY68_08765, partial [Gammaproteobacteria bacterium]|nr:hypothetical protein [Gammaproteobacteria bacterium]
MIKTSIIKKSRLIAAFMFLLLLFCSVAIVALLSQQRAVSIEQTMEEAEHDLDFLGNIIKQSWLNKDYSHVERILIEWAAENHNTYSIKAVAANGFELVSYQKIIKSPLIKEINLPVMDNDKLLLTLSLEWDLSTVEKHYLTTRDRFIAGVVFFAVILAITFWGTLKQMVFIPLEEEFRRRVNAEKELQESHDVLEERVSIRT